MSKKMNDESVTYAALGLGRLVRAIVMLVASWKIFKEKNSFGWFMLLIGVTIQDAWNSAINGLDLFKDAMGDDGPRLRDMF